MTAGSEVVCNDIVAHKVEIEEKCVDNLDMNAVTVDDNVGGGNGDAGGAVKDESDDSSYVFVSGGDPGDTGGGGGGEVDIGSKSDSADEEVELFKEELGLENGGEHVDLLVLETNGIVHEVKAVKDDVHLENGSAVDPVVVVESNGFDHDVNGHHGKITEEEEVVVKSTDEVEDGNEINDVETKTDDIVSAVTVDSEPSLNSIESSQGTVFEVEPAVKSSEESNSEVAITRSLSTPDVINVTDELISTPDPVLNTDCEVLVNDEPVSVGTLIDKVECQVTVDGFGKQSEDLECQITADGSESSGSPPIKEREAQVTVDESVKPSEDLESQVTADGSESCANPIKEQECEVSVDGSESIGSLVDNQESPVVVTESEPSGNDSVEFDSSMIVTESDGKSEEHHEVLTLTTKVNVEAEPNHVCSGLKAEEQSDLVSAPYASDSKNSEGIEVGSGEELEGTPDSGLVLSEDAGALANGQVEKFDGILEMGETQISGTDADESEPLLLNGEKEKLEDNLEKQVEESSETLVKVTESVEIVTNFEEIKEQVKIADDIQESQTVVTDNIQDDLNLEDNTTESANEVEVSLEAEANTEPITHENTVSEFEVNHCINKPQEGFQPEETAENVEIIDPVESECKQELLLEKDIDSLSDPDVLTVVDQKVELVAPLVTENRSAEGLDYTTGIETVDVPDDEEKETEVNDASVDSVADLVTENGSAEGVDYGTVIENVDVPDIEEKESEVKDAPVDFVPDLVTENRSAEHVDDGNVIENVDVPVEEEKETEVKDAPVIEFGSFGHHETIPNIHNDDVISVPDAIVGDAKPTCGANSDNPEQNHDDSHGDKNRDKMCCQEGEDIDGIQSDEIPTSSVEGSVGDVVDVQDEEEVLAYNFLIRIPRYEDENFRDQIRSAQLQVEEKTRLRDAIRVEIQGRRARLRAHNEAFNAAREEETAARRLVRLKRQEIDAVQVVVNRLKNAMSVEDIDNRIFNTEHMIQHETLILRDEKQFIREIKQLKTLRDQLASNMGTPEEIRHAIDQKEHNEERMKTLRKELDSLKDKASKAEAVVKGIGKKYDEESRKERELQAQFRAADDVRQQAYAHLNSLKKLSYEKNKNFRLYKDDVMAARDFASRGDKDSLHRLCANQVEAFMEQWNNNDEFRNEYVTRCAMIASRRQRALEAGSLAPEDVAPVHSSDVNKKVDRSLVSTPSEVKSVSENIVSSTENKHADKNIRSIEIVSGQNNEKLKTKGPAKPTVGSDDVAVVADLAVVAEVIDVKKEEENKLTKEVIELARKAEELRKEEIAAKLKEQKRLEEKAKAIEALERKKRNAEKAQVRAEMRARKEAEQKEKEREKRLRKKEKKKTGGEGSINGEEAASSESSNENTTKETETVTKEVTKKKTQKPPAHFFSKQLKPKPIPPPLVNRNKKRWQQWGKIALAIAVLLALFLIGNTGFFVNLKVPKTEGGAI